MEYYWNCTPDEQLQLIRKTFSLKVNKKDRFAKLHVGSTKHHVRTEHPENQVVDFIEDGDELVPSHCLMTGEPDIDDLMADLLTECILEKFRAIP